MMNIVTFCFFLCNLLCFLLVFTLLLKADLLIILDRCNALEHDTSCLTLGAILPFVTPVKLRCMHTHAILQEGEANIQLSVITAGKYLASQIQIVLTTVCLGENCIALHI